MTAVFTVREWAFWQALLSDTVMLWHRPALLRDGKWLLKKL
jgi:hypothetical protein